MELLRLIRNRNRSLKEFCSISEALLDVTQKGNLEALDEAQIKRDKCIQILKIYEEKIETLVAQLPSEDRTERLIESVRELELEKQVWLAKIQKSDDQIIACIESESEKIQKEIQKSFKQKGLMGRFKSTWVKGSGGEVDQKL